MYLQADKANTRFKKREHSIQDLRLPAEDTDYGDYFRKRSVSEISQDSTASSLKTSPSPTDIPTPSPRSSPSPNR